MIISFRSRLLQRKSRNKKQLIFRPDRGCCHRCRRRRRCMFINLIISFVLFHAINFPGNIQRAARFNYRSQAGGKLRHNMNTLWFILPINLTSLRLDCKTHTRKNCEKIRDEKRPTLVSFFIQFHLFLYRTLQKISCEQDLNSEGRSGKGGRWPLYHHIGRENST